MSRTAVLALGGNALARAGEPATITNQFRHARESVAPIVQLARDGWRIAIVHGNGPQVGDELARNELARREVEPLPLGVLVAATAGWIGYMLQQSLQNALRAARVDRDVVTVITQTVIDPYDPALNQPTKPIGHALTEERVEGLREWGFAVGRDGAGRWRRLAASPRPTGVLELGLVRRLVDAGAIVIAAGGGGPAGVRASAAGLRRRGRGGGQGPRRGDRSARARRRSADDPDGCGCRVPRVGHAGRAPAPAADAARRSIGSSRRAASTRAG